MLEGKSKPVSFNTDIALFDTLLSQKPFISYSDLYGLNSTIVDLQKNENTLVPISYPTIFRRDDLFLVYPGESIKVTKDKNESLVLTNSKNKQRNKELAFIKKFVYNEVCMQNSFEIENHLFDYNQSDEIAIQTILNQGNAMLLRFENTANKDGVSSEFKNIVRYHFEALPLNRIIRFYIFHKDSFLREGKFNTKLKSTTKFVNKINNIDQITYGYASGLSDLADGLLPLPIYKINNTVIFKDLFDSCITYFTGIPRDFVLTKILYHAYKNRVPVPPDYLQTYYTFCHTPQYSTIIKNVIAQQKQIKRKETNSSSMLSMKRERVTDLETLLAQHKGKLVLLDFWASWCQPCIAEIPALQKLQEAYAGRGLQILNISFDKEIQKWKKFIIAHNLTKSTNFIFANARESDFVIKNRIEEIPRYMLISRDGMIITSDAPSPSDPALRELIDKNL